MNRKRSGPAAVALAALGVATVALLLVVRNSSEDSAVSVLTEAGSQARGGVPLGTEGEDPVGQEPSTLVAEREASADDAAAPAADPAFEYEQRTVSGRVRTADGGPIPRGLWLSAATRTPYPRVRGMEQAGDGDDAFPDVAPASVLEQRTRTDVAPDGRFQMEQVPRTGAYLVAHHEMLFVHPLVRMEPKVDSVQATLVRGAIIQGRVQDPAGQPIGAATVEAGVPFDVWSILEGSLRGVELEETETGDDGRFLMEQVPPGYELRLHASSSGFEQADARVLPLQGGEVHEVDFALVLGAVVTGTVVSTEGEPLPDIGVQLRGTTLSLMNMDTTNMSEAGPIQQFTRRTDDQGTFRFEGVSAGEYELILVNRGYRPARHGPLQVTRGERLGPIELLADPALAITGQVVDAEGAPVSGARVRAHLPPSPFDMQAGFDKELRLSVRTDDEGRFTLAGYDEGKLEIRATAEGFIPVRTEVEAGADDVRLVLQQAATVTGIVVSLTEGEPVTDYRVSLIPAGGVFDLADMMHIEERIERAKRARRITDEEGRFTISDVMPGKYDLTVTARGFGETTVAGVEVHTAQHTRGVVVMLPEASAVTGRVVSQRTGEPVEGARIAAGESGGFMGAISEAVVGTSSGTSTDAEGRFELADLGSGPVGLTISHPSFQRQSLRSQPLLPGERLDLGIIELSSGAAVWGQVFDQHSQTVPGVAVLVAQAGGVNFRRATTDDEGAYRVEGLNPGTYNVMRMDFSFSLTASSAADFMQDMVLAPVTLGPDEEKRVDLRVDTGEGTVLEGYVLGDAGPQPGVIVSIMSHRGATDMAFDSTDKNGFYRMHSMSPGRYVLTVQYLDSGNLSAGSMPVAAVSEDLTLGDEPVQRHDIHAPGAGIRGTVESRRGFQPLGGVRVLLERTDAGRPDAPILAAMNWRTGETYTDEQGAFSFPHVAEGTYDVVAGGTNLLGMGTAGPAITRVHDVEVSGDGTSELKIEMEEGGSIAGEVTDSAGKMLAGAAVWARNGQGHWLSTFSEISSDDQGQFTLEGIPRGTWTLVFRHPAYALTTVAGITVRPGKAATADVVLPAGIPLSIDTAPYETHELQVTLTGPGGPVPLDLTTMADVMPSDSGGMLNLGRHLPGSYHVVVLHGQAVVLDTTALHLTAGDAVVISLGDS